MENLNRLCEVAGHIHLCKKCTVNDIRQAKYLMKDESEKIDQMIMSPKSYLEFWDDLKNNYKIEQQTGVLSTIIGIEKITVVEGLTEIYLINSSWLPIVPLMPIPIKMTDHRLVQCVIMRLVD